MEIVIKIPDKVYKFVQNTSFVENENTLFKQTSDERLKTLFLFDILDAIKNGASLPKGHGRLIDADELYNELEFPTQKFASAFKQVLDEAPTIIEADKAGEEE